MRNLLTNSLKVCAFVVSILLSVQAIAQQVGQSHLNCPSPSGTSGDLAVVNVFVDAPACASCTGGNVTYPLKMTIHNGTKSVRTAFALYGTLSAGSSINGYSGNIVVCVGAITVSSSDDIGFGLGNQTFTVGSITFPCSSALSLTNNVLAWTDASGTTTDRCNEFLAATSCKDVQPKCGVAASISIRQPLSFSKSQTTSCSNSATGSVTVTPIGGTSPYTIVIGGTTFNNVTTNATKSPLAAATYNFTVTDAAGCTASSTQTVSSQFCCTAPGVGSSPLDIAKCPGESVSFTASASGGDPAPTTKWQAKQPGGAFADIVAPSAFSGFATNTLSIPDVTGLSGYQFRAIFTSTDCTPATSNPATLTVKTVPPTPSTIYHPPACDKTTFSVEVTNVVNGATYTIKKGDGGNFAAGVVITPSDAIVATSTSNITFSNIPAGSGFRVSVVKDGCSPAAATCSTATVGTPAARANNVTTTTIEIGESQTTVKAYPNPFSDRVKFVVTSSVAGQGNLDVYNMMGQKVKTVYTGFIAAGTQTFELSLPTQQVSSLVYVLRVGDKKVTGKILQINQ